MKKVITLVLALALVMPALSFGRDDGHGRGHGPAVHGGHHTRHGMDGAHRGGRSFHGGFYRGGVRGYGGYYSGAHGYYPNHWHGAYYREHGRWYRRNGYWALPFIGGVIVGGILHPHAYWVCDYPVLDRYGRIVACDGGHWQY